jgi:hypothetical protein
MASNRPDFEPLEALGENNYLYEPQDKTTQSLDAPTAPSLVILCTWAGGATPRRVKKYISQYQHIYPTSSILILTTNVANVAFWPVSVICSRLKPACQAIQRILAEASNCNANPGTLLHMFSHGGGGSGSQLALAMKESDDKGASFFAGLRVILDCCPGDHSFEKSYGAAQLSVPENRPAQLLGKTLLYPAMSVVNGLQNAGILRSVRDLRAALNDPDTLGLSTRRLYMYTKEDPMIGWVEVQAHLEEARSLGYQADSVVFDHGTHCGLIMEDPERYWSAVQRFWSGQDPVDVGVSSSKQLGLPSRL